MHLRRSRVVVLTVAATLLSSAPAFAGSAAGWSQAPPVPLPDHAADGVLRDVSVLGPGDVWAIGAWSSAESHMLAVHWDGKGWTVAPTPDDPSYVLTAVDAVASADVWAVGSTGLSPLLTHYDGSAWSAVAARRASPVRTAHCPMWT